ncbi:Ribonuclease 2 [Morella rubra]|uniref:Ribonuclease 2 n=1 Tax=Morella rubra TaxID=262757 RepID=A0A6A1WSH0_9ROSI|nr:Ribonuclease 2 [Morella rubra]
MASAICAQTLLRLLCLQFPAAVIVVLAMGSSSMVMNTSEQREFDYFALALQWPGTVCYRTRHCCSSNACCRRYP